MGNPRKKLDQFAIHPEFGAQFKPLAELTTPFQSQTAGKREYGNVGGGSDAEGWTVE